MVGHSPTQWVHTARAPADGFDSLAVPVHRGSTITFPDYASFAARGDRHRSSYSYGLSGTPTTRTLQNKLTGLESAHDTFLVPSGLMAITVTCLAVCEAGDTVLLPDNVYAPVRRFAAHTLARSGVHVIYYDPCNPHSAWPEAPATVRMIWVETPGSVTMEITDLAALRALADRYDAIVGCDNSWASPVLCRPLEQGADIVVEALTKYMAGHSDVLMGSISVRSEALAIRIHECIRALGAGVSPDDCFLVLRGMESASVRLAHVGAVALRLAGELQNSPCVEAVLHPALESFAGHGFWKKQFDGASGLFSIVLKEEPMERFAARFNALDVFRLGASWGGTHSILAPVVLDVERTVNRFLAGRKIVRISVGLEDEDGLRRDLARCFGAC